jgi:heparosan-N-sulfate-glucuronate 5-epimerase
MKKILSDISKYISSTAEYSPNFLTEKEFLYPIDLDFTLDDVESYYSPQDEHGIPFKEYSSVGKQYNPTRIAAYALANYSRYKTFNEEEYFSHFMTCVDWFMSNLNARYEYNFDWDDLTAPWISCMAQGEAVSVLVRAYKLTGDQMYIDHAELSLRPFFVTIEEGGVQSTLPDGSLFIEEYPSRNPTHVLNGCLYALIGLGEFISVRNSIKHIELFEKLSSTVVNNIEVWSAGYWSLYESKHNTVGLNQCTPSYHNLHISQLKWLNKNVDSPELDTVIEQWAQGLKSFPVRVSALYAKVRFRLRNRAQR